jgi:hypothetical protein
LAEIVDWIADDRQTLASLALVNSDCRQLARSCQFAAICFDYSPSAHAIVRALAEESSWRRDGAVLQPTIGACVRRITVSSDRRWVSARHPELSDSFFGNKVESHTDAQRLALEEEASKEYYNAYYGPLLAAISGAMPHLQTIAWHDRMEVDAGFFKAIFRSPAQHIKLARVPMDIPYHTTSVSA